jgi:hypothetical protein
LEWLHHNYEERRALRTLLNADPVFDSLRSDQRFGDLVRAFCILILRWRHVAPSNWAVAMLLLAIPGMVGEAVVLSNLGTFMPRIQEASGGRYGAFLFGTYAIVLGIAEFVTLRSAR